ncbi:hypothetical protein Slin_2062 [Spirosoma linguale DSM 74]|uniref:Uncharacterized protein n=1 Tax=Spirosoma linguale (strain ATCC 33905 / DSM 74 / LMG 10896 / Claus 1) TaxID=504472 RepID=D2QCU9_SPILD|nr:hypothetical protein Slin_2062 [Spirosoma linguale DSM 74]
MKNGIQKRSLSTEIADSAQLALIEWTKAINEFRASYLALSKTDLQLVKSKRSSTYLGQCLESQPTQLLAVMCQELVLLSQEIHEPFNCFFLQVHTSRLQRLTHKANQLISLMKQPMC